MNACKPFLLFTLLSFYFPVSGQISIDRNDMPDVGDTIRYNVSYTTNGYNYKQTGGNHNWDFTFLSSILPQEADTFVHVWSTPLLYQIVFLYPFVSTIASPQPDFTLIPGFEMKDMYLFFKESNPDFREVGTGFKVNDVPIPFLYDNPDIIYRFPMNYNNTDSCISSFDVQIPDVGYYSRIKKRINSVDGWGTISTPFGVFQALRMKTVISQRDSVYLDTYGIGVPIVTETTEYSWLAKGFGRPVVKVVESGLLPPRIEFLNYEEEILAVNLGADIEICQGETAGIKANVTGGEPPYFYLWNTFQTGDSITVSPSQTTSYSIVVMDSKFQMAFDTVEVKVHEPPIVDAGEDVSIIITTTVQLNGSAQGGQPPYTCHWSPETGLSDPCIFDPVASPAITTVYSLEVTDQFGCTGSDEMTVQVIQVPTYAIGGIITDDVTGQGVAGVSLSFTGLLPVSTDANGNYSKTVHEGWSGSAVPELENYTFTPVSRDYSNVTSGLAGQDYLAHFIPPVTYIISGHITDQLSGNPSQGVVVEVSGEGSVVTDNTGYYSVTVTEGWTGTVTPVGYEFIPEQYAYSIITHDFDNQDFIRKQGNLPPGWQFVQTNKYHVHNIPVSANPRVYGVPISAGDYIGVFFIDDNGNEKCGGALQWNGSGQNLTAYGNDDATPEKDGFDDLETLIWKIYTWNNFSEYYAEAAYYSWFINDGKFHNLGFSRLTNLEVEGYAFDIRVILAGAWNGSSMGTDINTKGYIPLSQPYNTAPWNYSGVENVNAIPNGSIVDWVLVEIRETSGDVYSATSQTVVDRMACFVRSDGRLVSLNGAGRIISGVSFTNHLYPVVWHRNHLGIIAKEPLVMKDGSYTVDLTRPVNVLGGLSGTTLLAGGNCGLAPGDGDSNGQVANPDKIEIWEPQSGNSGYYNGDFNLNGEVDNTDKIEYWNPNSGKGTQVVY